MSIGEHLKQIPFLRLVAPLIIGIISQLYFFRIETNFYLFVIISFLLLIAIAFNTLKALYSNYSIRWIFGLLINSILFFSAYVLVNNQLEQASVSFNINPNGYIIGNLSEKPVIKEKIIKTTLKVEAIGKDNEWIESDGQILIYLQKDTLAELLEIGNRIIVKPKINEIKNSGNPGEFDYENYLMFHLISEQSYLKSSDWKKIEKKSNSIKAFSENIRDKFLKILKDNGISGSEFSVLSALTVGYKNELDNNIKRAYSSSGAMHVLAVSGLHVGIIFIIFSSILFFFKKIKHGNIYKSIILLLILWSYAFLTGLSPSVLRATTMFSFVVIAQSIKRPTNIYNTITASAFLLIVLNPFIITEVGFQLSYLAVIGIIYFQPKIYKILFFKNYFLDKTWSLVSVSLAAQITTTPISLYYFHQFPNYFIITNIVVIPIVTIIIYMALILFVVSGLDIIAFYVGKALNYVVLILNKSVIIIEQFPYSLSENIYIDKYQTLLFYLIVIFISAFIYSKKIKYFRTILITLILILCIQAYSDFRNIFQRKLIVYNIAGQTAINFIDGKDNLLISSLADEDKKSKLTYITKNNWLELGLEKEKIVALNSLNKNFLFSNNLVANNTNVLFYDRFVGFYNKKYLIINKDFKIPNLLKKAKLDIVIITSNTNIDSEKLFANFIFDIMIIDSSNSNYFTNKLKEICEKNNIKYYITNQSGAYIENLTLKLW